MLYVKITKCTIHTRWYDMAVGGIFPVKEHDKKNYAVAGTKRKGLQRLIYKTDCELVNGL